MWERVSLSMEPVSPAPGGQETGPNSADRGKLGSKRHIVVDARGIPLTVTVIGANGYDSMAFEPTLDAVPAVSGLNGQSRKRPRMRTRAMTLLVAGVI